MFLLKRGGLAVAAKSIMTADSDINNEDGYFFDIDKVLIKGEVTAKQARLEAERKIEVVEVIFFTIF